MTYLHVLKAYRSLTQCCSFTHIHTRYTQSGGQWLAKREVSFKENAFIFPTSRLRVILSLRLGRAIQSKPQSLQEKKVKLMVQSSFSLLNISPRNSPWLCAHVYVRVCVCVCKHARVCVWTRLFQCCGDALLFTHSLFGCICFL